MSTSSLSAISWKDIDTKGVELITRTLRPEDGEALTDFLQKLSSASRASFQPHPFTRKFVMKMVHEREQKHHLRLVVENPKTHQIVAYAFLTRPPLLTKLGYFGIAVADNYQGRKISSFLMNHLFTFAQLEGIKTILLNVYENNQAAIAAYQKRGFERISAPFALNKFITIYELWHSQKLSDLWHRPPHDPAINTPSSLWMRKSLSETY